MQTSRIINVHIWGSSFGLRQNREIWHKCKTVNMHCHYLLPNTSLDYWVFGFCQLWGTVRKHIVSETGSASALRWETPSLLVPSERANPNRWTGLCLSPTLSPEGGSWSSFRNIVFFSIFYNAWWWTKSKNPVILIVIYNHQNPLEFTCTKHTYVS
jgi:hypothetical protein